jgi:ribonuclease HI
LLLCNNEGACRKINCILSEWPAILLIKKGEVLLKTVVIHTDGGCAGNQSETNVGGWGALLEYNENVKTLYGGERNTTNNRMEMMAVIEALKILKTKDLNLEIYSDSAYLVNCFRERWYDKWRLNGWTNASKKPVENRDLWEELLPLVESFQKVEFLKIKGHLNLKRPAEIKPWKEKIEKYNGRAYSDAAFRHLLEMNAKVDLLANQGIDETKNR